MAGTAMRSQDMEFADFECIRDSEVNCGRETALVCGLHGVRLNSNNLFETGRKQDA